MCAFWPWSAWTSVVRGRSWSLAVTLLGATRSVAGGAIALPSWPIIAGATSSLGSLTSVEVLSALPMILALACGGSALSACLFAGLMIPLGGGRCYFWTRRRWWFGLSDLDVFEGIEPLISSALYGFLFRRRWCDYSWRIGSRPSFVCSWGRVFGRQLFFSGFLRAVRASYFFSISRLKPLAAGNAAHLNLAHARTPCTEKEFDFTSYVGMHFLFYSY